MEPRGEPAGYGQDDIDLLNQALKLLADIPGTDDAMIGDALTSPFLGVKCRVVVAAAARVRPDVLAGDEQAVVALAFGQAFELAGWPRVLQWAVQLTPALIRVITDPAASPLRDVPGAWGTEGDWLFLDATALKFLEGVLPGEDWRVTDRGAGAQLQFDTWEFPLVPSGEVP